MHTTSLYDAQASAATTPVVVADGLGKVFGKTTAVHDFSLSVDRGEIFGILGPSGAGKTTAIRMLAGVLAPTTGRAEIAGHDVTDPRQARRIKSLTGYLPEGSAQDPDMTVPELIEYFTRLQKVLGGEHADRIEAILETLRFHEEQPHPAIKHRTELGQRLGMAKALAHNPSIVFFDEPTANLKRSAAETVHEFIKDLRDEGRTVILTTRVFKEAERLCDRMAVMNIHLLAVASPRKLRGTLPVGV